MVSRDCGIYSSVVGGFGLMKYPYPTDVPMAVDSAIISTMAKEGDKYTEHRHDYPTKHGIRQEDLDACECETPLPDLSRAEAYTIWFWKYWIAPKLHMLAEHSMLIAEEVFDTGVLSGPTRGIKMLQQQLNAFNYKIDVGLRYGDDIEVDGICGPNTARRLGAWLEHRDNDKALKIPAETVMLIALNCLQHAFHVQIADGDEGRDLERRSFVWGWLMHRVIDDIR